MTPIRLLKVALLFAASLLPLIPATFAAPAIPAQPEKKRLVVLTDIEADADDSQSVVRLLLYSNQIDLEGLIATTSIHQGQKAVPASLHKIISAYEKVQPNLLKHEPGFPSGKSLHDLVKSGLSVYGMDGVGEGKDSQGSDWIIHAMEKQDPRPLWIAVFGGPNTLAQALWKIQRTRSAADAARLISRIRVHTIGDQDNSGPWIRKTFPDLIFLKNDFYGAIASATAGSNRDVIGAAWLVKNIQQGHGPLGLEYPDTAYGMEGDTPSFLGLIPNGLNDLEHPEFGGWGGRFQFGIPVPGQGRANGAGGAAAANGGGRAGRAAGAPGTAGPTPNGSAGATADGAAAAPAIAMTPATGTFGTPPPPAGASRGGGAGAGGGRGAQEPETRPFWYGANDTFVSPLDRSESTGPQSTIWRWREEYQNDFSARMAWTTAPDYKSANHPPVAVVQFVTDFGAKMVRGNAFTVKSGDRFGLTSEGSSDPDGDSLSYLWSQIPEAGTYGAMVPWGQGGPKPVGAGGLSPRLYFMHTIFAPEVDSPKTIHFVLKVTDKGTPALSRYQRVIITVQPK